MKTMLTMFAVLLALFADAMESDPVLTPESVDKFKVSTAQLRLQIQQDQEASQHERQTAHDYISQSEGLAAILLKLGITGATTNTSDSLRMAYKIQDLLLVRDKAGSDLAGSSLGNLRLQLIDSAESNGVTRATQDFQKKFIVDEEVAKMKFKYFEGEETGNWVESLLNRTVFPTRWEQELSPWEVVARAEPIVVLDSGAKAGLLWQFGAQYNRFPTLSQDSEAKKVRLEERAWYDFVDRVALRIGGGAVDDDGHNPVAGAGVMVNQISAWGLYDFDKEDLVVAIGVSEFKWLKNILPLFE